jgi:2-keto-4-pentenoate hydratase
MTRTRLTLEDDPGVSPIALIEAAWRLENAVFTHVPCAPVRDLIGADNVTAAYAVQQRLSSGRFFQGARVVGRKIGLTSPAVQAQLGVDQPDFGVLFADMQIDAETEVPLERLLQPKVEAEIAFVLGHDLIEGPLGPEQVRAAVAYAVAAIEIVDSRIAGWDISFADTVADNASGGLFVLGSEHRDLSAFEPAAVEMAMSVDGIVVSTGTGTACLGDPLHALRWLAEAAREFGEPLLAGQVVLSGALGPMAIVGPGSVVSATITGLGEVHATFSTPVDDTEGTQR